MFKKSLCIWKIELISKDKKFGIFEITYIIEGKGHFSKLIFYLVCINVSYIAKNIGIKLMLSIDNHIFYSEEVSRNFIQKIYLLYLT